MDAVRGSVVRTVPCAAAAFRHSPPIPDEQASTLTADTMVSALRLIADRRPIFDPCVVVDWDDDVAAIKAIRAVPLWPGDPIGVPGFSIKVIGFEPLPFQTLENLLPVVKGAAVREKVTRPMRAGPVKSPAFCSIYMILVAWRSRLGTLASAAARLSPAMRSISDAAFRVMAGWMLMIRSWLETIMAINHI